jgi:hypothetical protein
MAAAADRKTSCADVSRRARPPSACARPLGDLNDAASHQAAANTTRPAATRPIPGKDRGPQEPAPYRSRTPASTAPTLPRFRSRSPTSRRPQGTLGAARATGLPDGRGRGRGCGAAGAAEAACDPSGGARFRRPAPDLTDLYSALRGAPHVPLASTARLPCRSVADLTVPCADRWAVPCHRSSPSYPRAARRALGRTGAAPAGRSPRRSCRSRCRRAVPQLGATRRSRR